MLDSGPDILSGWILVPGFLILDSFFFDLSYQLLEWMLDSENWILASGFFLNSDFSTPRFSSLV